jgi:hypothetical protein
LRSSARALPCRNPRRRSRTPPYTEVSIPLYGDLGRFAMRVSNQAAGAFQWWPISTSVVSVD